MARLDSKPILAISYDMTNEQIERCDHLWDAYSPSPFEPAYGRCVKCGMRLAEVVSPTPGLPSPLRRYDAPPFVLPELVKLQTNMTIQEYNDAVDQCLISAKEGGPNWNQLFTQALAQKGLKLVPIKTHNLVQPPTKAFYVQAPWPFPTGLPTWPLSWIEEA